MPDIPVALWSSLIGLLAGVLGVSVGAILQRRFERKHWERTTRLDVYDEFLTTVDALQVALGGKEIHLARADLLKEDLKRNITRVSLVGSNDAIQAARKVYVHLFGLDYAARMTQLQYGAIGHFDPDDMKEVFAARWAFMRATRKDVGARPVDIPRESLLPPNWEPENPEALPLRSLKPKDAEPPSDGA